MRISGLLALCLFLAIAAADGLSASEIVLASLLVLLAMAPEPNSR